MSERTLVVLQVSPWSERARWALDHHRVAYRTIAHQPFIGERRLRKRARGAGASEPAAKRATVPILIDGDVRLTESADIARYADRMGSGPKLFPPGRDEEVRRWNEIADTAMSAGRALVTAAMLHTPAALDETLPPRVPAWLRPALRPVTGYGTRWFARKYGLRLDETAVAERAMRAGLDALRGALAANAPYLLGEFSYADIVMATLLQGVRPVDHASYPIGPGTRAAWTSASLVAAYPDLLGWRDDLYRRHRVPG